MQAQGKHVILFIFGTALAAAVFAWTFQYSRGRRVLELWGADNARLIRIDSQRITIFSLGREGEAERTLKLNDRTFAILQETEITATRGIANARQALIEDASFLWDSPRGNCLPNWQYALEFRKGDRTATVLLDTNCQRARLFETGKEAAIEPKIFDGWMTFIDEQIVAAKNE